MIFFKKLFKIWVFSNSWVACCGALSTWSTYKILGLPVHFSLVCLLFLLVFAYYNAIVFRPFSIAFSEKFQYLCQNKNKIKYLVYLAAFGIAWLLLYLDIEQILWLLQLFFIAYLYISPTIFNKLGVLPLRCIPYLKPAIIAYAWVAGTWILPLIAADPLSNSIFLLGGLERFLYYFSLTIIFDLRDVGSDQRIGLATFANKINLFLLKIIVIGVLIVANILAYWNYPRGIAHLILLSNIPTVALISVVHTKKPELFFTGYLDGVIIVQALLIITGSNYFLYLC